MQPTDHTSTGGGRLDDRVVDMQTKWWDKTKHKQSERDANRMAVEMKMEDMQNQPDTWEREQSSVDQIKMKTDMFAARKLQIRDVTLGFINNSPQPGTKYCIQAKS